MEESIEDIIKLYEKLLDNLYEWVNVEENQKKCLKTVYFSNFLVYNIIKIGGAHLYLRQSRYRHQVKSRGQCDGLVIRVCQVMSLLSYFSNLL